MIDEVLRAAFLAHTEGKPMFTRRMAISIGLLLGWRPRNVVLRLEAMGLLRKGSWRWFADNGGITAEQIEQVRNGE